MFLVKFTDLQQQKACFHYYIYCEKYHTLLMDIAKFTLCEQSVMKRQKKTDYVNIAARSWVDICTSM